MHKPTQTGSSGRSIELKNHLSELEKMNDFVDAAGEAWDLPEEVLFASNLALSEIVSNIIRHGYDDSPRHSIRIFLELKPKELVMRVEDEAGEFDPLSAPEPDTAGSLRERKIGGLGIFLVKRVMDEVRYERSGATNVVTLRKNL